MLGHEIGHITARHPVRQQTQSTLAGIGAAAVGIFTGSGDIAGLANYAGAALISGYGRDKELEADRLGAEYLARTGLAREHMIDVVRLLKNQEMFEIARAREEKREPHVYHGVFATHPDNDQRLREVVKAAGTRSMGEGQTTRSIRVANNICGRSKECPSAPVARKACSRAIGSITPIWASPWRFRAGWTVENQPDRLLAISPKKDSILQMQTQAPPPNTGPQRVPVADARADRMRGRAKPIEVNGLQGYTAVVRSARTEFGVVPARYAVIYYNNLAYVFAGASKAPSGVPSADALFMSTIKTFRRLKQSEFPLAEPYKIKVITADCRHTHRGPRQEFAHQEISGADAAADERPLPGQGAASRGSSQDRRIAQRVEFASDAAGADRQPAALDSGRGVV